MPPGQPIHRCADCEELRPCKPSTAGWLCADCAQLAEPQVATDGGEQP